MRAKSPLSHFYMSVSCFSRDIEPFAAYPASRDNAIVAHDSEKNLRTDPAIEIHTCGRMFLTTLRTRTILRVRFTWTRDVHEMPTCSPNIKTNERKSSHEAGSGARSQRDAKARMCNLIMADVLAALRRCASLNLIRRRKPYAWWTTPGERGSRTAQSLSHCHLLLFFQTIQLQISHSLLW